MRKFKLFLLTFLLSFSTAIANEFYSQVIKIQDETEVEKLTDAGVEILRRRGDILLCYVPVMTQDEEISDILSRGDTESRRFAGRKQKSKPYKRKGFTVPTLDHASQYFGASNILNGNGYDHPYTGKGIVVGICDIGFDPLHPTFLDSTGNSRVRRLTHYDEDNGRRIVMEGDDNYAQWITDDAENYHATHVGGIIAGNGAGTPYIGIAKDADIVVSTSSLTDVGILAGVEDIIEYGKEVNQPVVINLSLGNYVGAHDGSSLFSQYLDLCAEDDAIIVLSAGNEGNHNNYLTYRFSDSTPQVGFRLGNKNWDQIQMYGETDVWSDSATPLKLQLSIFDDSNKQKVYTYPELSLYEDEEISIEWNRDSPVVPGLNLQGDFFVRGGTCQENGRYRLILSYDFESPELVQDKTWAKHTILVEVKGQPGQEIDVFSDGTYTRLIAANSTATPNSTMSISDLACGYNVISVGMYGNRESWPVSSESGSMELSTGYEPGKTVVYSSYGTLRDGRILPNTVAPGASLVSAFSRPYAQSHPDMPLLNLSSIWTLEGGTSMASPYVAGFIATWLEAIPTLKSKDILDIISATNRFDIDQPENPRNVMGWFDPESSFRKLIDETDVRQLPSEKFHPEEHVEIFSTSGALVYSGKYSTCQNLPRGIFIIKSSSKISKIYNNN